MPFQNTVHARLHRNPEPAQEQLFLKQAGLESGLDAAPHTARARCGGGEKQE